MANTKQSIKRVRQNEKRQAANYTRRSMLRTELKKFDSALASGDKKSIGEAFTTTMSALHRAATKGIIRKNTASRKISRMAASVRRADSK